MRTFITVAGVGAAVVAIALSAPAVAETVDLGDTADVDLVDIENGVDVEVEQHWTISDLRPSADAVPHRMAGSLWEATAAVTLDHGGIPVISGFVARSATDAYPVLWTVASPRGISPAALPPGGSVRGKLYFDVTGAAPDRVTFVDADDEAVEWRIPTTSM